MHRRSGSTTKRPGALQSLAVAVACLFVFAACEPTPTVTDPPTTTTAPPPPATRKLGYYSSWSIYERDYQVAEVPAERLTHLAYAFANVRDGGCVLGDPWADVQKAFPGDPATAPFKGNLRQLQLLKAKHPHLRTLIAVGGSTWSAGFSSAAATTTARQRFARSCADFMERYGFVPVPAPSSSRSRVSPPSSSVPPPR